MVRKIFFVLGLIVVAGFALLLLRGRTPRKAIPDLIELPTRPERALPDTTSASTVATTTISVAPTPVATGGSIKLLFDQPLGSAEIAYPELYAYDVTAGIYRVFNLTDRTYRDLYANPNLIRAWRSPSGRYLAIEQQTTGQPRFAVLDFERDRLQPLDPLTQKIVWTDQDDLILHLSNQSRLNVLARWRDGQITLLGPIGLLSPHFVAFANYIFIAGNHDAPLLRFDLVSGDHRLILNSRHFIDLAARDGAVLVTSFDHGWQTLLFDQTRGQTRSFSWGAFPEKCTLTNAWLICASPKDISTLGLPEDWLEWRTNSLDDLVFFDRNREVETRLTLDRGYDILRPNLTPLGVIFTNRFDGRLYLIPTKELPLDRGPAENDQPVERKQ